jgi:hypothetical protein
VEADDAVCRRLMTVPSVGPLVAITYKSAITRAGDEMVRTALYEAANVLLARITRFSKLKRWAIAGAIAGACPAEAGHCVETVRRLRPAGVRQFPSAPAEMGAFAEALFRLAECRARSEIPGQTPFTQCRPDSRQC